MCLTQYLARVNEQTLAVVVISNSICILWADMDLALRELTGRADVTLLPPSHCSPRGVKCPYRHASRCSPVCSPSEFLVAQYHRLPYTHGPALPGKGGWASLLARIQPGQVLGFRGQRKGTFQGSTYFLRTSVPISLAHMIYWDILHVPNVSMLRKIASVGQSCGAFLYKCTGVA